MAIEPSAQEQGLIDQYALAWIEANEDRTVSAGGHLRSYAESLEKERADATKAVERLISSGKGEALKALDEHWGRVKDLFSQTGRAAIVIAVEIQGHGDTIVIGKHHAQDLLAHLASTPAGIGSTDAEQSRPKEQQAVITRQELQVNADTALTDTKAGAARAKGDPDVTALGGIPATVAGLLGGGGTGRGIGTGVAPGIAGGAEGGMNGIAGGGAGGGAGSGGGGWGIRGSSESAHGNPQVGTNAGNWSIFVNQDEHKRAANGLSTTAEDLYGTTTQSLARARHDLDTLAAGGSLGASIAAGHTPLLDQLDSATRALADHLDGPLRDLVLSMSTDQQKTDEANGERIGWLNGPRP
ncbi:hypothetical protein [Streptomyces gardneri]|uniref:hypothetical protein n=1 Tax=Streptomyces gardneri TaxID=66892 RepID=UPI003686A2E1